MKAFEYINGVLVINGNPAQLALKVSSDCVVDFISKVKHLITEQVYESTERTLSHSSNKYTCWKQECTSCGYVCLLSTFSYEVLGCLSNASSNTLLLEMQDIDGSFISTNVVLDLNDYNVLHECTGEIVQSINTVDVRLADLGNFLRFEILYKGKVLKFDYFSKPNGLYFEKLSFKDLSTVTDENGNNRISLSICQEELAGSNIPYTKEVSFFVVECKHVTNYTVNAWNIEGTNSFCV